MSMKQTSKKELIIIKSVEPRGWGELSKCLSGGIPPLGTVNEDSIKTSEDIPCGNPISDWSSIPDRGGFEILTGKTSLSFKTEPDKVDSQDVDGTPKDHIRGHDTYSGQFEFEQLKNSQRIQGAVDGFWDPENLMYSPYHDFRVFEIWTIVNPMDANGNCDMSMSAVKCDTLMKHYEVILDSLDESRDIPNKLTVPISRRFYERYKNFTFPTSPLAMLTGKALVAGTPYNLAAGEKYPREQTRLWFTGTLPASGTITIYGANMFGEPVEETLNWADKTTDGLVGHVYFATVNTILSSVVATVTLQDFDYKMINPV